MFIKGINNEFCIISAKDGKAIKKIKMDYEVDTMPVTPIGWNENILFGSKDGKIYLINRDYKWEPLLFLGTSRVQNIFRIGQNKFVVSNMDGRIIMFSCRDNS